MAVYSKLVLVSAFAIGINAQFAARPDQKSDSSLPQNLLDAQQQFREAQEKLKDAQEEAPKGRSLANLVASLQDQATTEQNQLLEEVLADPENYEYGNYEYGDDSETTTVGLSEDAMRRRKKKKKPKRKPAKKPVKKPTLPNQLFDYGDSTTVSNVKPVSVSSKYPAGTNPKNKAKAPVKKEFDDKGQWIGGGQFTDYDYYDTGNTFNAMDQNNKLQEWDSDPTGKNNNNWGENSFANADLGVDYGFQVNPDMPSFNKQDKNNKENRNNAPAQSSVSSGTSSRATWDAWGECTAEKIAKNADLLSDEFTVLKLHNYGCWCTIIGEKRECLKGKPQDPIDTFCRDWLACRRCTLFAPHYCGREDLHNKDENAYGLEFFQKIIGATFTCDHLSGDDCAYNRCLCDKEMGEQIMCKMDTFTDIHVGVDVEDCPRHNDADYCAPDSCCGEFPNVTPWSTTCHTCENGTRSRL